MKSWDRPNSYLSRGRGKRQPKATFLVVCEGKKTEPYYFEEFRVSSADINIKGIGRNTDSLVEYTIDFMNNAEDSYDQVWCVFDRDSFDAKNFNRALQLARSNNIKSACSNEAFEIGYLLHFHYFDTGMSRELYEGKLSELLGRRYKKNDRGMYMELLDRQPQAIANASRLLKNYTPPRPESDNPSTEVFKLVEALNKYID